MPVYWREDCAPGVRIDGPALVAEDETTIAVPAAFVLAVDAAGNVLLEARE